MTSWTFASLSGLIRTALKGPVQVLLMPLLRRHGYQSWVNPTWALAAGRLWACGETAAASCYLDEHEGVQQQQEPPGRGTDALRGQRLLSLRGSRSSLSIKEHQTQTFGHQHG